jgi:hypothetical protein
LYTYLEARLRVRVGQEEPHFGLLLLLLLVVDGQRLFSLSLALLEVTPTPALADRHLGHTNGPC